jgi:hypothetical protein
MGKQPRCVFIVFLAACAPCHHKCPDIWQGFARVRPQVRTVFQNMDSVTCQHPLRHTASHQMRHPVVQKHQMNRGNHVQKQPFDQSGQRPCDRMMPRPKGQAVICEHHMAIRPPDPQCQRNSHQQGRQSGMNPDQFRRFACAKSQEITQTLKKQPRGKAVSQTCDFDMPHLHFRQRCIAALITVTDHGDLCLSAQGFRQMQDMSRHTRQPAVTADKKYLWTALRPGQCSRPPSSPDARSTLAGRPLMPAERAAVRTRQIAGPLQNLR